MNHADRIAIFIDSGYWGKVIEKEHNKAKVNYGKLSKEISGSMSLLRAYFMTASI